jgi:hypothetical protein
MSTTILAPGLSVWTLENEAGATRAVLASSMQSAIGGSPVKTATKGAAYTPGPPPVATALVPPSAKLGDANFTLHVQGTGFRADDVIVWNGGAEPTTFVSATELTTGVNMASAAVAMPIPVLVRRLTGLDSNALTFDLQPAP